MTTVGIGVGIAAMDFQKALVNQVGRLQAVATVLTLHKTGCHTPQFAIYQAQELFFRSSVISCTTQELSQFIEGVGHRPAQHRASEPR